MIYLHTSFLTPLFREEATTAKVAKFLSRQSPGTLAVSTWASVEFASLISRDVRMGAITASQGRKLIAEFASMMATSLVIWIPNARAFDLAREYVAQFATQLRAPDALHLAVAHINGAASVATLDNGMLAAAKKLKIPAQRMIR